MHVLYEHVANRQVMVEDTAPPTFKRISPRQAGLHDHLTHRLALPQVIDRLDRMLHLVGIDLERPGDRLPHIPLADPNPSPPEPRR